MTLTRAERIHILAQVPWIKRLRVPTSCDALRWSQMPLQAIYGRGNKPPTGTDKYKCKNRAYWHFRALKRPKFPARDGNYCQIHLMYHGIYYSPEETTRFERWYERYKRREGVRVTAP